MSARRPKKQAAPAHTALLVVALVAVVAGALAAVWHFTSAKRPEAPPAASAPAEPGGKTRGRADAPVTIEVYSDFL
jgi:flagellar basal body-associated protein FliL